MPHLTPVTIYALTTLLGLASSQKETRSSFLDQCEGISNTNFNATGSVTDQHKWNWRTGLRQSTKQEARQYYWLDTPEDDLNSPDYPFKLCAKVFWDLSYISVDESRKDNGNCEATLGKPCLDALNSLMRAPKEGGTCDEAFDFLPPTMPDECAGLKSLQSSSFELSRPDGENRTCNSTTDNPKGEKSVFFVTGIRDNSTQGTEVYDDLAKRTTFVMAMDIRQAKGQRGGASVEYICLKNTDFAEGSRNPFEAEKKPDENPAQPAPTQPAPEQPKQPGSSAKNGASLTALTVALFLTTFVLFS